MNKIQWYDWMVSIYECISSRIKVEKSVKNHWRSWTRQTSMKFVQIYKNHIWENQTIFWFTEICPDGKDFGLPKYVKIQLYGLLQNWDWL